MTHTTAQAGTDAFDPATQNRDGDSSNVFMRSDTLLGVCQAIGQDFGFNPLWLRLAFIPAIFFLPVETMIAYLALGVVVLASRLLFPAAKSSQAMAVQPSAPPLTVEPSRTADVATDAGEENVLLAA